MYNGNKNKSGFSLLEISIVLLVVSVSVSSGVLVFNKYSAESKISQTEFTMAQVMSAIKQYALKYGELPCPADITLVNSDAEFGFAATAGTCAEVDTDDTAARGLIPVSTLNLYPSLVVDAWGNRISYVVLNAATAADALSSSPGKLSVCSYDIGACNYEGVIVALISHGANGRGAFGGRGGAESQPLGAAEEQETDNASSLERIYVSVPFAGFDDIVTFWTYDQITNTELME